MTAVSLNPMTWRIAVTGDTINTATTVVAAADAEAAVYSTTANFAWSRWP
ncbi:MAG: hypothetical protein U1E70_02565 [Acetobacteraceae bacterium]